MVRVRCKNPPKTFTFMAVSHSWMEDFPDSDPRDLPESRAIKILRDAVNFEEVV